MWMIENIPSHVVKKQDSTVTNITYDSKLYSITYISNGEEHTVKARMVVGADGAKSAVRHRIYPKLKLRTYMAIQQWFDENNPKPFYSCVFDSENTDCCSWSISKDGKFIFGGAYPVEESRKRFEAQKQKLISQCPAFPTASRSAIGGIFCFRKQELFLPFRGLHIKNYVFHSANLSASSEKAMLKSLSALSSPNPKFSLSIAKANVPLKLPLIQFSSIYASILRSAISTALQKHLFVFRLSNCAGFRFAQCRIRGG
jgi:hypothetical protein